MSCEFENTSCPIPGNFICKKCKLCGHMVGMAAAVADIQWPQILTKIEANCEHAIAGQTAAVTAIPQIVGRTFDEVAKNVSANIAGIPTPAHPPYVDPTLQNVRNPFEPQKDDTGPGSQLKRFLSRIGITSTPTCSCNAKAQHMDAMGVDWCEQNIDLIVSWLKDEAHRRSLPFVDFAGRMLVNRAIAASKKAQANKLKKLKTHDLQ